MPIVYVGGVWTFFDNPPRISFAPLGHLKNVQENIQARNQHSEESRRRITQM